MDKFKRRTSFLLAVLMLVSTIGLFASRSASAANEALFESGFEDSAGWTLDPTLSVAGGKLHSESWTDYLQSAITDLSFDGTYTFRVDVEAPLSSGHWNATRLLWGYQDPGNYYELLLGNASTADGTANVTLKKIADGAETSLASDVVYRIGGTATTLQVAVEDDGRVTIDALQGATVTRLFEGVAGQASVSGRIGLGVRSSPIDFDRFRAVSGLEELKAPEAPVVDTPTMEDGNFLVQGSEILDPDGLKFVAKGVNVNGPRWPWSRPTIPDVALIADAWKFNTVRVNMYPRMEHWDISNNMDLDGIVNAFTSKRVVTMLENHDFTGSYPEENGVTAPDGSYSMSIDELTAYWVDLANKYKNNPYVWFNLMNEPGQAGQGYTTAESVARWNAIHERIIAAIRASGAENVIVLDGHFYGQENGFRNGTSDSAILTNGQALAATYDNLVFSLHLYAEWSNGQTRLENYLDEAAQKGLAVIIGEYGADSSQTSNVTAAMFNAAAARDVGRLAWAWEGEDGFDLTAGTSKGGGWEIDKTDGARPANLSWFGSQVWDDNHGALTLPVTLDLPVMTNGNFEAGLADWQNWSNAQLAEGAGIDGSKAFKVAVGVAGGGGQFVTVKPNTSYKLTVWGRTGGTPADGTADVGFQYRPTEQSPDSDQIKFILSFDSADWTKKEVSFTTGPSVAGANVFIWKSAANVDLFVDNVSLAEQPPLVANGGFEDDLNGWMNWGRLEIAPGAGADGSKALKVTAGGAGGGGQFLTVKPNTTYKLSIAGKVSGATGADGAAAGFQYKPTEQSPDSEQIKHVLSFDSTAWATKEVTFTTGPSVAAANVFVWKAEAGVDLWLDDVRLAEATGGNDPDPEPEPKGLTLDSVVFKNEAGAVVTRLPDKDMLFSEVTATNDGPAQTATFAVALYDKKGKLTQLSSVTRTLQDGETLTFTGAFGLPNNTKDYTAKVMVWNNPQDRADLVEPIVIEGGKKDK